MKKTIRTLIALLLIASLPACSRRKEFEDMYESLEVSESLKWETSVIGLDTEIFPPETGTTGGIPGESQAPGINPDGTGTSFGESETAAPPAPVVLPNERGFRLSAIHNDRGKGSFEGLTEAELAATFTAGQVSDEEMFTSTLTPLGVVFQNADGASGFYNKLTSHVTPLCPDPLCDETECLFTKLPQFLFIGQTHMYFMALDPGGANHLYRCDLNRNHVECVYKNFPFGNGHVWAEDGDTVYVTMPIYREGQSAVISFGRLDVKTGEYTSLSGEREIRMQAVAGDTVWFIDKGVGSKALYKTNRAFESPVPVEATGNIIAFNNQYLIFGKASGAFHVPHRAYCIETDTYIDLPADAALFTNINVSGDYLYYTKPISKEEIDASPLEDYYNYKKEVTEQRPVGGHRPPAEKTETVTCRNTDAGRIWRLNLLTGEEECVMELTYNGVPVWIQSIAGDGNTCFFTYNTYEEYNNYYNSDYPHIIKTEPVRFGIADFGNGTVRFADTELMED